MPLTRKQQAVLDAGGSAAPKSPVQDQMSITRHADETSHGSQSRGERDSFSQGHAHSTVVENTLHKLGTEQQGSASKRTRASGRQSPRQTQTQPSNASGLNSPVHTQRLPDTEARLTGSEAQVSTIAHQVHLRDSRGDHSKSLLSQTQFQAQVSALGQSIPEHQHQSWYRFNQQHAQPSADFDSQSDCLQHDAENRVAQQGTTMRPGQQWLASIQDPNHDVIFSQNQSGGLGCPPGPPAGQFTIPVGHNLNGHESIPVTALPQDVQQRSLAQEQMRSEIAMAHHLAVQRQRPMSDAEFACLQAQISTAFSPRQTHHQPQYPVTPFANPDIRAFQRHHVMLTPPPHGPHLQNDVTFVDRGHGQHAIPMHAPATVPRPSMGSQSGGPHHELHARTFSTDSLDSFLAAQQSRANPRRVTVGGGGAGAMFLPPNHRGLLPGASIATHRPAVLSDASMPGGANVNDPNLITHVDGSPITRAMSDGRPNSREDTRMMVRQIPSLGQMGAAISSAGQETGMRIDSGQIRPAEIMHMNQARSILPQQQQMHLVHENGGSAFSLRSRSPTETGFLPGAFLGNMSPQSSIATGRFPGDSSIDTSIDSISNSATTMSAMPSQASSISDDFLSLNSGHRRSAKGKTRLRNIDRKAICEAARNDPKVRQEDLAARFGIERSTVSKTLKNKDKWLAIEDDSDGALIVKHRTGKFPAVEERLYDWLRRDGLDTCLSDVVIRDRSLEIAREVGLQADQFKASLGWIEKFRERYRIPKAASNEAEMRKTRRTSSQPFKSAVSLTTNASGLDRYVDEVDVSDARLGGAAHYASLDGDVAMFASSPRVTAGGSLRSFPTASTPPKQQSDSHEGSEMGINETPKASKRHYDDMAQNTRSQSADTNMMQVESNTPHEQGDERTPATLFNDRDTDHDKIAGLYASGPKRRRFLRNDQPASTEELSSEIWKGQEMSENAYDEQRSRDSGLYQHSGKRLQSDNSQVETDGEISGKAEAVPARANHFQAQQSRSPYGSQVRISDMDVECGDSQATSSVSQNATASQAISRHMSPGTAARFSSFSNFISQQLGNAEGDAHTDLLSTMSMLSANQPGREAGSQRVASQDEAVQGLYAYWSYITNQQAGSSENVHFGFNEFQHLVSELANHGGATRAHVSGEVMPSSANSVAMSAPSSDVATRAGSEDTVGGSLGRGDMRSASSS